MTRCKHGLVACERCSVDSIDMTDPHGVWAKAERAPTSGFWDFNPSDRRPSWLHRVMAKLLLGWEWRDG